MAPFQEDRAMLQNRLKVGLQVLRDQAEVNAGKVAATGYLSLIHISEPTRPY